MSEKKLHLLIGKLGKLHLSVAPIPAKLRTHLKLKQYLRKKLWILAGVTLILFLAKLLLHWELSNRYTDTVEHASLFCDLLYMGTNNE
jgi:hypothetical protein